MNPQFINPIDHFKGNQLLRSRISRLLNIESDGKLNIINFNNDIDRIAIFPSVS